MHTNFYEIPNFIPQISTFSPKLPHFPLSKRQLFSILTSFAAKTFVKIIHKKLPLFGGRVFLVFLQRFVELNIAFPLFQILAEGGLEFVDGDVALLDYSAGIHEDICGESAQTEGAHQRAVEGAEVAYVIPAYGVATNNASTLSGVGVKADIDH